jgi:uncharacterized protein YfaS (alpha-2-macroglobulin family)
MSFPKRKIIIGSAIVLGLLALGYGISRLIQTSGNRALSQEYRTIDPAFSAYIHSFTSGFVSRQSPVRIRLQEAFAGTAPLNTALKEAYFSFRPALKGQTIWKDAQTLEFIPSEPLKPGTVYEGTFHLDRLTDVRKELKTFGFRFQTVKQSLQLQAGDLKCYQAADYSFYSLSGTVASADVAEEDLIEKTVVAAFQNKPLNLKWVHEEGGLLHRFLIDSIERPLSYSTTLTLTCDGAPLNVAYQERTTLHVPAKQSFELLGVRLLQDGDPCVLLNFSNPVDEGRSLEGLIQIQGLKDVKYIVSHNQVWVYPQNPRSGAHTLKVDGGIRDTRGESLLGGSEHSVVFGEAHPAVRFLGRGNILPSTSGLSLPFETVNLRAVDVTIVKIYENNVLQFLQNNSFDGSYQLAQVGKRVLKKRVPLGITNPAEFGVWKKSALDLSSLLKSEPGAIYRVSLSFRKSYATYPCLGQRKEADDMEEVEEPEQELSYFNSYNDEYDYYYGYEEGEEYNWMDRNNPCKSYYYIRSERTVSRNILASDLGLTLKKGNDGSLFVCANDLVSTRPLGQVSIELYDYQKQRIQTTSTNSDGQAFLLPERAPSFIIARHGNESAYLKLDEGESLSLSMYDISGAAIKKGLKGFIYGERGVWRPGDSLFLNFILEDKGGTIPAKHPVTLSLFNPQGQLYKRMTAIKQVDGIYNFPLATDKNAPTGFWNAELKVGAVSFNKSIRIESIMPNRLKIGLEFENDQLIKASRESWIRLHANWLTGATAKNLAVNMNVTFHTASTSFPKYKDYVFDNKAGHFEAQHITVFDGRLDEAGNARIPFRVKLDQNAPGLLKATFNTMVFEPGGAFSIDRFTTNYAPYDHFVGVKLPQAEKNTGIIYTGREHNIQIATVDANGNPVSRQNLKFEMYKLEWRWWWDQSESDLANYATDDYHRPVQSEQFSSRNGTAAVRVHVDDNDWGRYLIRVSDQDGGHVASLVTYFDWANWMERGGGGENRILASQLNFTTDKTGYKVGEEVSVMLPSPDQGRALITIENGARVLEAHWVETGRGNTTFRFRVTPQMAPNVYVHVSLMQPHVRENDLPIRLFGVLPVLVDDPGSHLKPVIQVPAVIEPEKKLSIVVGEENNREMAFTLAVVDEGLLDITRFRTPEPHPAFYAREALGVKTWDVYDQVIGAFGADLERILSVGGDGSELNRDGAKANRFKPMVRFFGPYHLSKGEKKTISFTMPAYVGSVRTMVIAGYKGAYGHAEKTSAVKAPLMLLGTLPRVLSVTEEVKLPVSVFGGDKPAGATEVKVEVNGLLQVLGGNRKTITIGRNDEKLVLFDLKVKDQTGIAKVKITATGGGHTTQYEMELDVRNPNPYETRGRDHFLEPGQSLKENYVPFGVAGTNTGVLELSTLPPLNLEERLQYLIAYPHGCLEQTTSQAFAQLYVADMTDMGPERKLQTEQNIKAGIQGLRKFQLVSGGFAYWPGNTGADDWATSYAGHFLVCAEKKGYTLPVGLKSNWLSYQQKAVQSFDAQKSRGSGDELQAYRLYVLALANNPVLGAMNRLREFRNLSVQARWLLAAAYAQAGQPDEASKLMSQAPVQIPAYQVNYATYGSSERDMAIVLQTLCLMNKKQQAFTQFRKVSEFLSSGRWLSTQTMAFGLVAAAEFAAKYGGASAMQAVCQVNGKEVPLQGKPLITQVPLSYQGTTGGSFRVENRGQGTLYLRSVSRGKAPIGEEQEGAENISASVSYQDMDGAALDPSELAQGTNFKMLVTVKNLGLKGDVPNIALSNFIPSGWEIHNMRLNDTETAFRNTAYTYQDIRDDRVQTYFDLGRHETKTIQILLNASYEGRFYLPGVQAEAMYDNTVYSRTKGQWVRVLREKSSPKAGHTP